MTFSFAYQLLVHALAFIGLSLTVCIALHVWKSLRKPSLPLNEHAGTELADTQVTCPSYLRVVD